MRSVEIGVQTGLLYIIAMKHLRIPLRLSVYLLRAHLGAFIFSLSTLMFIFLLQFVMKFIDQLVGKGLSAWTIMELITLNLAWMLVLAVPMSVLVAVLMAFGDLSSKNEITAMKASGVSIYKMIAPILLAAGALTLILIVFNNDVLPEANHRAKTLTMDIRRKRPTFNLVAGLFSQDIQGYSLMVRKTFEGRNELEGLTLYDYTNPNSNILITAKTGTISFSSDARKLIMDLHHGEIHELDLVNMTSYKRIRFETHRIVTEVQGFDFERTAEGSVVRGDRELNAATMRGIVDSLEHLHSSIDSGVRNLAMHDIERLLMGNRPEGIPSKGGEIFPGTRQPMPYDPIRGGEPPAARSQMMNSVVLSELLRSDMIENQIDQYKVEIYKKYSIPVACIVFVLIGVPLGIMSKRGGFGVAASLSLGFFVLYWAFLSGGETLADRNILAPFSAMWAANILFGVLGCYLTVRIGKESVVFNWNALRNLLPQRWRPADEPESSTVE